MRADSEDRRANVVEPFDERQQGTEIRALVHVMLHEHAWCQSRYRFKEVHLQMFFVPRSEIAQLLF